MEETAVAGRRTTSSEQLATARPSNLRDLLQFSDDEEEEEVERSEAGEGGGEGREALTIAAVLAENWEAAGVVRTLFDVIHEKEEEEEEEEGGSGGGREEASEGACVWWWRKGAALVPCGHAYSRACACRGAAKPPCATAAASSE